MVGALRGANMFGEASGRIALASGRRSQRFVLTLPAH
jgi:hypothetical protein